MLGTTEFGSMPHEHLPVFQYTSHDQRRIDSQSWIPRFSFGAGCSALPAGISDGWAGAGRQLVCSLLHCSFCHFALSTEAIRSRVSICLDTAGLTSHCHEP